MNRARMNAYQRTYRQENHEKILAWGAVYREKNRDRMNAQRRARWRENSEKCKAQCRAWYRKNRKRQIAKSREWNKKNRAKVRTNANAHYHNHRKAILRKIRESYNAKRQYVAPEELEACRQDVRKAKSMAGPDFIVCLECGEKKRALSGHLKPEHNLTAKEYKCKPGSEGKAPRYNVRTYLSSVNCSKRRSRACKRRRHGHWLPRSRPPLAKMNAAKKKRGLSLEARMNISDRMKGRQHIYLWKKRPDGSLVTDFQIARLRLQGKEILEICRPFGMTDMSVIGRLRRMGFPRGRACLFEHGEPIIGRHILDLVQDFKKTKKELADRMGRDRSPISHVSSGEAISKPLSVSMARQFLSAKRALRSENGGWAAGPKGGRPHSLSPSETRDMVARYKKLRDDLWLLRDWLQTRDGKVETPEVWSWLCEQSRKRSIRTLLFWPEFLRWMEKNYGYFPSLRGDHSPSELAFRFLASDYHTSAKTIKRAFLKT